MLSAILIATTRGELLLHREYKADVRRKDVSTWLSKIVGCRGLRDRSPIWTPDATQSSHFLTFPSSQVVYGGVVKDNPNVTAAFAVLIRLADILKCFVGEVTELSIRRAIPTILSILDEVVDFGVPQILDRDALKSTVLPAVQGGADGLTQTQLRQITTQVTGAVSWRGPNIKYRRNEVYIDVLEAINTLVSATGQVLRTEVSGQIVVKCLLSGMPECKFAINDRLVNTSTKLPSAAITLEDTRFHQCVRRNQDASKSIVFIPPDGVFQLMMYRTSRNVTMPFKITPVIQKSGNRLEVSIKLRAAFPSNLHAVNVIVHFPTPEGTASASIINCYTGKAKFEPGKKELIWAIRRCQGDSELTLVAELDLAPQGGDAQQQWTNRNRAPMRLEFELPMFTASGLKVRFLKIQERSGYKAVKWIRYVTKAGMYNRRI